MASVVEEGVSLFAAFTSEIAPSESEDAVVHWGASLGMLSNVTDLVSVAIGAVSGATESAVSVLCFLRFCLLRRRFTSGSPLGSICLRFSAAGSIVPCFTCSIAVSLYLHPVASHCETSCLCCCTSFINELGNGDDCTPCVVPLCTTVSSSANRKCTPF